MKYITFFLAIILVVGCTSQEKVKIGFIGTSDDAQNAKHGVELAMQDMQLSNIKLVNEDSACDSEQATIAVNKVIASDHVQAIISALCDEATLAAASTSDKQQIVFISVSSAVPETSETDDYVFRTMPSQDSEGKALAKLVFDKGNRDVAVLSSNDEYGHNLNESISSAFTFLGGRIVAAEAYDPGSTDVQKPITKVKQARPDAIAIIGNAQDSGAAIIEQIYQLNIRAALFGSEQLKSSGIASMSEGTMITALSRGTSEFKERYAETYGEQPGLSAAQGYDAFKSIATATQTASVTGEALKDVISQIQFDSASGRIQFDENHESTSDYDIFIVQDGSFVQVG